MGMTVLCGLSNILCWVLVWFGFFQVQVCWVSCILLRPMVFENGWNSQNRLFEKEKGIDYTSLSSVVLEIADCRP